eukprot:2642394-Pyramimonas_sp.AAC.1
MDPLRQDPDTREESVLDLPCYSSHPDVQRAADAGDTPPVPLGLYLDGVVCTSGVGGRADTIT